MNRLLARLFDLRPGETRVVLQAFATLFLLIAGHTILETARDALFLTKLPPSRLTVVYAILAGLTFFATAWSTAFARRFGRRNALVVSLVVASFGTAFLHAEPPTSAMVLGLYVFSGLIGTILVAQFWTLAGQLFTTAQGKRLFGPIASGGVVGAVFGATTAAGALSVLPVTSLLLIATVIFLLTAVLLTTVHVEEAPAAATPRAAGAGGMRVVTKNPFLMRVAALVALSTAAALAADYLFKSTAARTVPAAELGVFFARYYAVLNAVALSVQLLVAGRLVRRLGVAGAVTIMPLLLLGGGASVVATGGLLAAVLVTKGIDGGLRHSLHRVASELLFLPLPADLRDRGKALIDTVLGRVVQAAMAGVILALATLGFATPRVLGGIVAGLSLVWLVVAVGVRRPYLDLFRHALASGTLDADDAGDELDLTSVEALLEALSSRDPDRVIGAMNLLHQKKRARLLPALILYHDDHTVLVRALEILAEDPKRDDWVPLAERLLANEGELLRVAVVRALAKRGIFSAVEAAREDASPAVRAYALFHLAHKDDGVDPLDDPTIKDVIHAKGPEARSTRRALLDAIYDSPDPRWANVLLALANERLLAATGDAVEQAARAMARIGDVRFIPVLIARLAARDGRDAVRQALVSLGEPALTALEQALADPATDRRARLHIPRTISRFANQRACEILTDALVAEKDGLIRYKVLRGLGRLVADHEVSVDRARIEKEMRKNLIEHMRILSLWLPLEQGRDEAPPSRAGPALSTGRLLIGLLEDKMRQSLERAFRLMQIAHKTEHIQRAYLTMGGTDRRARANATEFVDALTLRGNADVRALMRLVIDDLDPAMRIERARDYLESTPRTYDEALSALLRESDESLAAIAAHHALELGSRVLRDSVAKARLERPTLGTLVERFFGAVPLRVEATNAS